MKTLLKDKKILPDSWESFTWMEAHARLFAAVQNEMMMMYVILFIIVLVAAFCVMNTMITVTVQKRREIGIIAALGTRIGQVMWVFLWQGMMVGAFGSLCGLGAGLSVAYNLNSIRDFLNDKLKLQLFDPAIYGLIDLPAKVLPWDVAIICGGAFVLCTVAALVPGVPGGADGASSGVEGLMGGDGSMKIASIAALKGLALAGVVDGLCLRLRRARRL